MVTTPNYDLDIDNTLGGINASDYVIPSQKAIKTYVDNNSGGGGTVDQTYDGTSTHAQSGIAIAGAGFLQATNGKTAFTNTGTEATMGYTDTNTGEMYGVLTGNTYYGTGVILGAQSSTGGYLEAITTNGLSLTDGTTMKTAVLTVDNSNNLLVNGSEVALVSDLSSLADTDLSNLSATGKTVIDGKWVVSYSEIVSSNITLSNTYKNNWSLSTYLPNDNYIYEVIFSLVGTTTNTSGASIDVRLGTDIVKNSSNECYCMCLREQTRNSSTVITCGTITLPVGTGRKVYIQSLATGTLNTIRAIAYRRVGSNTQGE